MAKQYYYYKCDEYSKVGRALGKFWRKVVQAAYRADAYAKKYGACNYEQPVQFFEGGVDYLIFETTPDERVWRKKLVAKDGTALYEPNCMYRADILVIPDDRFHPSNTWNKIYSKKHLTWEQAKPQKTLDQWAAIAKMKRTDDREKDAKALDERMSRYSFVSYLEFYGDESVPRNMSKADCPAWLRRAIRAEQDRQALPVVEVYPLFALLDMKPEGEGVVNMSVTPNFFLYGDSYYICAEFPCFAEGLHTIMEGLYTYKQNMALRQEKAES